MFETSRRPATETVLVGDVVGSRRFANIEAMLALLRTAIAETDQGAPATRPLRLAQRDQFSGTYSTLGGAVTAALRLRLVASSVAVATTDGVHEPIDIRIGIGRGHTRAKPMTDPDSDTGAAWWAAADALRAAEDLPGKHHWPPSLRSVFRDETGHEQAAVNAYLLCQDQLLARMDLRDRRALLGLLNGERQVDVATELGITQPAIAKRLRDRGAFALYQSLQALSTAPTTVLANGK